jgi:hypothetical protein
MSQEKAIRKSRTQHVVLRLSVSSAMARCPAALGVSTLALHVLALILLPSVRRPGQ